MGARYRVPLAGFLMPVQLRELVFGTQRAALAVVYFQKYHIGKGKRNKLQQGKLDTKNSHSEGGQRVEQDPEGYGVLSSGGAQNDINSVVLLEEHKKALKKLLASASVF